LDHRANLEQLWRMLGTKVAAQVIGGRVGFRLVACDRLPLLGGVPDAAGCATATRLDQPRFVPRAPGLYVHTALASRDITWAALTARTLAAIIAGTPVPLEASLLDATDAGRFASREARRESKRS
jgi:tRNA 5-methylaminomethyl-2-thiouridine biosynthesis bifunctional protein